MNNIKFCSHRGFNTIAPENSMIAFAAAIVSGADEIEIDLWPTKDKKILVMHDSSVDRTTNGTGKIIELDSYKINQLDNGSYFSKHFIGLKPIYFDSVLEQFGNSTIINIHIKSLVPNALKYDPEIMHLIIESIYKFNCEKSVYIAGNKDVLSTTKDLAPEIELCCLEGQTDYSIVDKAIEYNCCRLQFHKDYFNTDLIKQAHDHNLICNLFWCDDPFESKQYFDLGIDVILTNDFLHTSCIY